MIVGPSYTSFSLRDFSFSCILRTTVSSAVAPKQFTAAVADFVKAKSQSLAFDPIYQFTATNTDDACGTATDHDRDGSSDDRANSW